MNYRSQDDPNGYLSSVMASIASYETQAGRRPTQIRVSRADFDKLQRLADQRCIYPEKWKQETMPRNQMMIDGVVIVSDEC